jgi:3-oxoacyl-[acyl-carrier-protein] synthase-3
VSRAAVIRGLGASLPSRVVTNEELSSQVDTSDAWIRQRTGIGTRRVIDSGAATSDLAVDAGQRALKSAGVDDAGLVVLATTTPDHPCPATAPNVGSRLGLEHAPAFDVSAVCTGFLYALVSGAALVTAGVYDSALVIAAESFSTILDPADRTNRAIFGDGAGAVVLGAGESGEPGTLLASDLGSDGSLADLITVPGGGSRQRSTGRPAPPSDTYFHMEGKKVFMNAVVRMAQSSRAVVERAGWTLPAIDWIVPHQANQRIIDSVADRLGVPRKQAISNIERVGNTAGASIPLALADAVSAGDLRPGHRVVLTAFGGGATWGSAALVWPDIDVL